MPSNPPLPLRLGDILVRQHNLAPHQLGVALAVQQRLHLPIGQILVGAEIITPSTLLRALIFQKFQHLFHGARPGGRNRLGLDLVSWGRDMLERHLQKTRSTPDDLTPELREVLSLRRERARLPKSKPARIVDRDDVLKERLLTGNF